MSDETKQMSKARQALIDRVLSRLDAGEMPWDNGMRGIAAPFNAVSNSHYRGINLLNLFLAGKSDPRWLTFNQAKDNGYTVKKGAKGVPIELYKTIDKRTGKDADLIKIREEIKDMTFAERQAFKKENLQSFARSYYVFNASDVLGIEPYRAPELTPTDISARNERIEAVIATSEAPIFYDGNGRNYYAPDLDEIHLTDRAVFTSDEFFYNTALHEMAHSTGHGSRLNRPNGHFGSKEYAREELVAEISSVLTAAELGLDHSDRVIENSAEYVRSWAQLIRDNPQTLIDAAFDASHATDYICGRARQAEKAQEEKTQKESLQSSVKTWYAHSFPTDELASELNSEATFGTVRDALRSGKDIYTVLGSEDSVVRERVFRELAEIIDVPYRAVYNAWVENTESTETRRERQRQAAMQDYPRDFADDTLQDAADDFAQHTPHYGKAAPNGGTSEKESQKESSAADKAAPTAQQHKKPLVVNFYGGPSCGKTTAALELTAALKKAGYNVEYVSEFAKQLVLEGKTELLKNQQYVTDGQYNLIDRIRGNADVIVTDSPVLLGLVYGKYNGISDGYAKKIRGYYDSFDNFNMFVERPNGATFQTEGRIHDEQQSVKLDGEIKDMLVAQKVFYGSYKRDDIAKTVERIGQTYNRLYGGASVKKTQKEREAETAHEFKTNLDNIPNAMKALPNWVAFRTEMLEDGKVKKILLSPNKGASDVKYLKWAKSDDPTTWATVDKALVFAKKYKLDGLAFAMGGSGMTCIDLDRCLDENGKPSELAQKFIAAAKDTYMEKSVSGHGLHIFYAGSRPANRQNRNIKLDLETYDDGRFISMTGNLYGDVKQTVNAPSDELKNQLASNLAKIQEYSAPSAPLGMDDNELIEKIRSSKRGSEFDALMSGEDLCGDHSVSDFKLCNMLAFFSGGDAAQVERVFRSSGLYRPKKGDAYVRRTAEKACSSLVKTYQPKSNTQRKNGEKPTGSGGRGSSGR